MAFVGVLLPDQETVSWFGQLWDRVGCCYLDVNLFHMDILKVYLPVCAIVLPVCFSLLDYEEMFNV